MVIVGRTQGTQHAQAAFIRLVLVVERNRLAVIHQADDIRAEVIRHVQLCLLVKSGKQPTGGRWAAPQVRQTDIRLDDVARVHHFVESTKVLAGIYKQLALFWLVGVKRVVDAVSGDIRFDFCVVGLYGHQKTTVGRDLVIQISASGMSRLLLHLIKACAYIPFFITVVDIVGSDSQMAVAGNRSVSLRRFLGEHQLDRCSQCPLDLTGIMTFEHDQQLERLIMFIWRYAQCFSGDRHFDAEACRVNFR